MKLAFISQDSSLDVGSWSGIPYHMGRSLEDADHQIVHISPLREKWTYALKAKKAFFSAVTGREYLRDREPLVLESYARQVIERLTDDVDVVFSPSTIPIARLRCEQPIVFWTDAAFAGMVDFYPSFSRLTAESRSAGDAMERSALERCALAIYSSAWAAETAVSYYGADPGKVKVVPFGANVEESPSPESIESIIDSRPTDRCHLLFNGVDWWRKGGDVAVAVARELNERGLETKLTVVGVPAGTAPALPFVRELGFVNKESSSGRRLIENVLTEAHFLILPSRAETFGIVLCEANAFGVPCLTTNVGGIPTIVRDDVNGHTFDRDAGAERYCTYLLDVFADSDRYRRLALASFHEYTSRLNWTTAANTVKVLLDEIARPAGVSGRPQTQKNSGE